MQFEKGDLDYCGGPYGVRGSDLFAEREGRNKKVSVLENEGEHWSTSSNKTNGQDLTVSQGSLSYTDECYSTVICKVQFCQVV